MNWYYAKNGHQNGPLPTEDMKDRIAMGEISPTDLAWSEGMADWMPVSQIPELKVEAPARQESFTPPPASAAPSSYQAPASAPAPVSPVSGSQDPMSSGQPPSQGMAIGSLICGILGLLTCCVVFISAPLALVAIVLGHVAISKIKVNPGAYTGKGLAAVGLIAGYLGLLATIVFTAFFLWLGSLSPEELEEKFISKLPAAQQQEIRQKIEEERAKQKK